MNLYQASRWFFEKSEARLKAALWLSIPLLLLTALALRPFSKLEDTVLITLIAFTQVTQLLCKYRSLYWFGKGDEPRRMEQFRSGMGLQPSPDKCAEIELTTGVCDQPVDHTYWLSQQPAGAKRMVEMILESSFYTRYIAERCKSLFLGIGCVGLSLAVISLVFAYRLQPKGTDDLFPHMLLSVLVFFLTGDFWTLGLSYRDLSTSADESHKQAFTMLRKEEITEPEALELAMSYNSSMAQGPPLLSSKHFSSRNRLDSVFKRNYLSLLRIDPKQLPTKL